MAESMEVDDGLVRHLLPVESIKIMGEAIGISNINDDAVVKLSEDLEYRLKEMIQDASKFMRHSKRKKMTCSDIDHALKLKNVEPLYGFDTREYIPFRHSSGGGKADLYYVDEKELGLLELTNAPLPRLPCDVSVRAHWLCVDGVQPVISENPPPLTMSDQRNEATGALLPPSGQNEPISHLKRIKFDSKKERKGDENVSTEWSKLKPLQAHSLSLEQQLYYKEVTDACLGLGPESKWLEALNSLNSDPGIYQLLPQFTSFINEGIKINLGQRKLIVLRHLVKMTGALMDNTFLSLEKYLHELIPSLISCLINKHVCSRPETDDQWGLRDAAAKVLAKMCKKYSNSINNIQPRVTRMLSQALLSNNDNLAVHYGAMCGLIELGLETISSLVLPRIKHEGSLIRLALGQQAKTAENVAANKLQSLLLRHCSQVLLATRPAGDTLAQYQTDYGSLGQSLFNQVKTLRQSRSGTQSSTVTARVTTSSVKSPTVTLVKNRPPPLSLSSPQVMAIRTNSSSKVQSPSIASPTIAAALQLVSQATKSNPATPTSSTPSSNLQAASLLSAMINTPAAQAVLAEHLTALSNASANNTGNSGSTDQSPKSSLPGSPQVSKTESTPSPKSSQQ